MSDRDSSDEYVEEELFSCIECPGSQFTAAEKDAHRRTHNETRHGQRRGRRITVPPPVGTDVTLFQPITVSPNPESSSQSPSRKRPRPGPASSKKKDDKKEKSKKVKSRKNYNRDAHENRARYISG